MKAAALIEHAQEWLEALLCAASSGDQKANAIYSIALRIVTGDEVSERECDAFEDYCRWVVNNGRDE